MDSSITPGLSIFAGNGKSIVLYDSLQHAFDDTHDCIRMVRRQNIFYAAAEDMSRQLFYLTTALAGTHDRRVLHLQSQTLTRLESKIAPLKGIYDDADNTLDPQSLKIWHALETAWETKNLFADIQSKDTEIKKLRYRL